MDCKTARENINIFDSLSQQEKDRVLEHAQSCEECSRELVNSEMLLEELSSLDELEAPEGLAQSAIKKAKKRKLPVYSYVSVAAAAVIAIAIFASSSILGPKEKTAEDMSMAAASKQESIRATDDAYGVAPENGILMDEMLEESEAAPQMDMPSDQTTAEDGAVGSGSQMLYIYVSADKKEFAEKVNKLLTDKGIYFDNYRGAEETQVYHFVVGEMYLSEFEQLLEEYEIDFDGAIMPGTVIQMTVEQ